MLIAVLLGFLFSIALVFFGKYFKGKASVLITLLPLSLFIYFLTFIPAVSAGQTITEHYAWIPSFNVDLGFTLDGLALLFCLMITGIGFLVFAYTSAYLKNHHYLDRFYGYLSIFMASMLGLVLSDNLISVFVFWELTSISSFFLIGFNNQSEASRKSAKLSLGITGIGGLFLLAAAIVLGNIAGTFSISEMLSSQVAIVNNSGYALAVLFIFGAAFTKSAQFPFHFWLPAAMKAPTPVSTYLHSATMVKAGIYLLLRLTPVLGGTSLWNNTLLWVGLFTMVYAAIHTVFRTDLKSILAYSTISALGIMVFLVGIGTEEALLAVAVFIIVHALYKATLFLITGAIDHATGTRDATVLRGLRKVMLPVAIAAGLAAISNAGIPPSVGFVGKDLIYEGTLHAYSLPILLTALAILTNILLGYAGYVVAIKPFFGKLPERFEKAHPTEFLLWFPPMLLGVAGLLFGIFPGVIEESLIKPIVASVGASTEDIHLQLWHGISPILGLSAITIGTGILLYFLLKPSKKLVHFIDRFEVVSPRNILSQFQVLFEKFSSLWTNFFQNGYLRNYISMIMLVTIGLVSSLLFQNMNYRFQWSEFTELTIYEGIIMLIMLLATVYTVFTKSRLAAVASAGIIGYSICLLFVFYSAPDLAMTQFAIDTLTVILFVLVLYKLPRYLIISDYKMRIRDGVLSLAFGGMISVLALEVLAEPLNLKISQFYAENAYIMAHGKNVVNVILVDFRGADTMIEISVLTVAAIGVFALLKLRLPSSKRHQ